MSLKKDKLPIKLRQRDNHTHNQRDKQADTQTKKRPIQGKILTEGLNEPKKDKLSIKLRDKDKLTKRQTNAQT